MIIMTQEEKARAYDESIKEAFAAYKDEDRHLKATLERIFPELKESEDERIRKDILVFIRHEGQHIDKYEWHKWIAWLEKQGEIDKASYEISEKEKREFVGDGFIKCFADFQDFKEGETYWLEYVGNDNYNVRSDNLLGKTCHITPCQLYTIFKKMTWLEKQGEQNEIFNVPSREVILAIWDLGNEWKELTKGSISTEYGTQLDYIQKHWQESEYYLRAKQSEQKPFDYENANIQQKDFAPENTPRYSIGDVLCDKSCTTLNNESQSNFEIIDIRNGMYICDKCSFPISQQDEYELVAKRIEQKPYGQRAECSDCQFNYAGECNGFCSIKKSEQKPAEWSEENEQYFNFLEKLLEILQIKLTENEIKKGTNSNSEYYYKVIQWLKSLKERLL